MNRSGRGSVHQGVADLQEGVDGAFVRLLYDEHGGPLYAFCVRWTGDPQRAEDVVQEVFLRAWRNLSVLDLETRPLRPWLLAVARNLLTDLHRAEAARPRLVDDESALAAVAAPDVFDQAVQSWQVAAAMQRLTREHRQVLLHAHWLGHSVAETAAALGVPGGTVKSRTYYALRALRLALEEMGMTS